MGLEIFAGHTYFFFLITYMYIFSGKNIIWCILKGEMPFKMHKIISFSPEYLKKILDFTSKVR